MINALFTCMALAYFTGALMALVLGKGAAGRWLAAAGAVLGAGAGIALGISVMGGGTPFELTLPGLFSFAGGMVLRLDALGAFFLILIGVVAIPAAVYGASYSKAYEDGRASLRQLGACSTCFCSA